jgi:hypothetical protein
VTRYSPFQRGNLDIIIQPCQVHPMCENCRKNGLVCVYPENTPKRAQTFGEPPASNDRATRRRTEGGVRPRLGYLSLQSGGRSRYLENTFWATVDEEVTEYSIRFMFDC